MEVLTKMNKNFKVVNNILFFCEDCNEIYKEKPEICQCGSDQIISDKVGDIRGPNWEYAIEVKIGKDLYSSLDGRVYKQLEDLSGYLKKNVALVFVGDLFKLALDNPDRSGQLLSIPATCMQYGVSWINVKNIIQLVKLLKYFASKAGKTPKLRIKKRHTTDLMPKRMVVLLGIKGVGEKLALELSKRYRSIFALALALHHDELRPGMIPKLGAVGIKRLKEWLN